MITDIKDRTAILLDDLQRNSTLPKAGLQAIYHAKVEQEGCKNYLQGYS